MTMQRLTTIFVSFLKIGMFTFGGGYAMLPLIERELITKRKWIEQKEFLDLLTLAQSVPGPIAVNTAVFVGYKVRGLRGAAAALLGTVTPSFVIILVIAIFFAGIRQNPFLKLLKNGFYFLYTLRRNAGPIQVKHHFIALVQCCCPWSKLMT